MTSTEEEIEIIRFKYKAVNDEYKKLNEQYKRLKEDYKQLLSKYEKRYNLYCEKVKDKVQLQNELEREKKHVKEFKDKYVSAMNVHNATLLEIEDLKKDNKEMSIETCVLAILLFVIMAVLALG